MSYAFRRRLMNPPSPSKPVPTRSSEAGSGIGFG
jgi:hypothetical protein